ncbi:hypothetical protein BC941DRAFT_432440 [Chlamydoabsidia padenii]|nr:hypothetical protein BC941DRAFT_432440 [Chlamydoabsidia padenii]
MDYQASYSWLNLMYNLVGFKRKSKRLVDDSLTFFFFIIGDKLKTKVGGGGEYQILLGQMNTR